MDDASESAEVLPAPSDSGGEEAPASVADAGAAAEPESTVEPEHTAGPPSPTLYGPPGPAGPVRKMVFIGMAMVGALLAGFAGARFIAEDSEDAGAVSESPTPLPTATTTPSPTASATATATAEVTPTPTRPAGVVPSGGGEQESFQRPNLEEPYEPPVVIEETETPPTPTPQATATPVAVATPAPTEAATPVETPTLEPAATTTVASVTPTTT